MTDIHVLGDPADREVMAIVGRLVQLNAKASFTPLATNAFPSLSLVDGALQGPYRSDSAVTYIRYPSLSTRHASEAMRRHLELEMRGHFDSTCQAMTAQSAMVVNDVWMARKYQDKLAGLAHAANCGFRIPETLFTSNQDDLLGFYDRCNGDIVYKPHRQISIDAKNVGVAKVPLQLIGKNVGVCPAIYQERLQIVFELRVVIAGNSALAAKITNKSPYIDIRPGLGKGNEVGSCELDAATKSQCIQLVRSAGLLSASIDLAMTAEGLYFLDLNPSGRFLWIEHVCPQIPVLDYFCGFLSSGDCNYEH